MQSKCKAKQDCYQKKVTDFRNNSKSLWGIVKHALKLENNKQNFPKEFLINGKMTTGTHEITNGFGKFYREKYCRKNASKK